METFKEIMQGIWQVLVIIGRCTADAAVAVSKWLAAYFAAYIQPSMPTMLKFFSNKKINMILFCAAAFYILTINIAAVCLFGTDKHYAKRRENRISERRLMRVCVWGGATGGFIGMNIFHHKTLKRRFSVCVPILFVIQLIIHSFVLGFLGFWAFF